MASLAWAGLEVYLMVGYIAIAEAMVINNKILVNGIKMCERKVQKIGLNNNYLYTSWVVSGNFAALIISKAMFLKQNKSWEPNQKKGTVSMNNFKHNRKQNFWVMIAYALSLFYQWYKLIKWQHIWMHDESKWCTFLKVSCLGLFHFTYRWTEDFFWP